VTFYKLNEVHDGFIMIFDKFLNLLSYIYIKNKGLQCQGILFFLTFARLCIVKTIGKLFYYYYGCVWSMSHLT
jgi:hypothetical protein